MPHPLRLPLGGREEEPCTVTDLDIEQEECTPGQPGRLGDNRVQTPLSVAECFSESVGLQSSLVNQPTRSLYPPWELFSIFIEVLRGV